MEDLKSRLQKFLRDFDQLTSHKKPSILFATKYLNKEQFVSFIQLYQTLILKAGGGRRGPPNGAQAIGAEHHLGAADRQDPQIIIGENRVQDAEEKINYLLSQSPHLRSQFTFVMIGHLQKNKINKALTIFDEIHSVNSLELAVALNDRMSKFCGEPSLLSTPTGIPSTMNPSGGGMNGASLGGAEKDLGDLSKTASDRTRERTKSYPIFLEVNLSGEPSKHGFKPEEIDEAISTIKQYDNLAIKGLLTMPPATRNPESSRPYFRRLRQLANKYSLTTNDQRLKTSMGTSQDWQIALEEGSDIIRIGSVVFK